MRYSKEECGDFWQCPECGAVNAAEENVADYTMEKCDRCQKMFLMKNKPHTGKEKRNASKSANH